MTSDQAKEPALENSPFLRYDRGNRLIVPRTILESIEKFLTEDKPAKDHITEERGPGGAYIALGSTWFAAINELFRFEDDADIEQAIIEQRKEVIMRILRVIVESERTPITIWEAVAPIMRDESEILSGWEFSYHKTRAELEKVQRTPEGKYISEKDGQIVEWQGVKSLEEEKADYIAHSITGRLGDLYSLIKLLSLVFITLDYKADRSVYHEGVHCVLYDDENGLWTSYLKWEWQMDHVYQVVGTHWHPRTCYTDPQWLQADLFALISTQSYIVPKEQLSFGKPVHIKEWEEAFRGYPYQYSITLDTKVIFGRDDEAEVYFDFMGKKLRWVNGTHYTYPVLVVPMKGMNDQEEVRITQQFLSFMVKEIRYPIRELMSVGSPSHPEVKIQQPRSWGMMGLPDTYLYQADGKENMLSEREWQALAFYREGVNAESPLYSFLNFFKILELGFGAGEKTMKPGIDAELPALGFKEWEENISAQGDTPANYLWEHNRNAIAHVRGNKKTQANPDEAEDVNRIRKSVEVVKRIAEKIIDDGKLK